MFRGLRIFYLLALPAGLLLLNILVEAAGSATLLAEYSPLVCPLNFFLGINCPTCGLTRSMLLAATGDFRLAVQYHFLGPVIFVSLLLLWLFAWPQILQIMSPFINRMKLLLEKYRRPVHMNAYILIFIYTIWGFFLRNSL